MENTVDTCKVDQVADHLDSVKLDSSKCNDSGVGQSDNATNTSSDDVSSSLSSKDDSNEDNGALIKDDCNDADQKDAGGYGKTWVHVTLLNTVEIPVAIIFLYHYVLSLIWQILLVL